MDDIDKLLMELEKDITNSCEKGSVIKTIKDKYRKQVDVMYSEFVPSHYERRYSRGGFRDEGNIDIQVIKSVDGVLIDLTNQTEAAGDDKGRRLDRLIEEGIYRWHDKPNPRPVYERTEKELIGSNDVEKALYNELKSRGW